MKLEESTRQYILAGLSFIVIVGLIVAGVMGKKQDAAFEANTKEYNEVLAHLQAGQYDEALVVSEGLQERQGSSEMVHYLVAIAASNSGEPEKGVRHLQRALDINPHKVEDALFMLQYAEALVLAEMSEEAGIVLERCTAFKAPESYPQYQERVVQLQEQIAVQS